MTATLHGFVYFHLKLTPQWGSMFISALQMKDLSELKEGKLPHLPGGHALQTPG